VPDPPAELAPAVSVCAALASPNPFSFSATLHERVLIKSNLERVFWPHALALPILMKKEEEGNVSLPYSTLSALPS
jgi:hypothetical protein